MVYLSPHIAGHIISYIPLNKKKVFVHCFPGNVPLMQGMFLDARANLLFMVVSNMLLSAHRFWVDQP